jgi:putative membrane protein
LLLLIFGHHDSIWWYLPLVVLFFVPLRYLVGRMPYLALAFISRRRFEQAVRDRAVRSFYEQGLYRTRAATGVLIFISLFERRVWILGDRGINARIAPEQWQGMVDQLIAGIRQGTASAALCAVILSCGQLLKQHFPDQGSEQNELQDDLITL